MNDELKGCSLADVLEKLEKGKIGHRAAMDWLNIDSLNDLVEIIQWPPDAWASADAYLAGDAGAGAID